VRDGSYLADPQLSVIRTLLENMTRKEFSREVAERVLIRSRRHCCVCNKFCGTKIVVHHIEGHTDNTEDNAISVCFDCHAEVNTYNDAHPGGRKYRPSELRKLREATYKKYSNDIEIPALHSQSDYGKGFHEGMSLAQKRIDSQLIWNFISRHGDFAIEILVMFGDDDHCSMMDETLYDDTVSTGAYVSQNDGHKRAWDVGLDLGLWNVDPERETLFLTKRGKFFRETVRGTPELQGRYKELEEFWRMSYRSRPKDKPGARPADYHFAPGWTGWLQVMQYSPVSLKGHRDLFILISVAVSEIILKSVESTKKVKFSPEKIQSIEFDSEMGILVLDVSPDVIEEC